MNVTTSRATDPSRIRADVLVVPVAYYRVYHDRPGHGLRDAPALEEAM